MSFRALLAAASIIVATSMVAAMIFWWFGPPNEPQQVGDDAETIPATPVAMGSVPTPAAIQPFLDTYCVKCHGPEKQKGDRRFDRLDLPVSKIDTVILLQDIVDQLNVGEMPPQKAKQPEADELRAAVAELTRTIAEARTKFASTGRQTVLRRLNRREYVRTVGDLFAMNMTMFDPTTKFPRDEIDAHMDNIGSSLKTSGYLLAQYLDAADQVVEKAFATKERPPEKSWRFAGNFQQQQELRHHGQIFQFRYLCLYETTTSEKHEGAYGPIHEFSGGVPVDGYYELKVKAEAKNRKHPYDPAIFAMDPAVPFRLGIVSGNQKAGALYLPQPIEPLLGETVVKDGEPEWYTFKVWLDAGHSPRFIFPNGMMSVRNSYSIIHRKYNNQFPKDVQNAAGIAAKRIAVIQHGKLPHIRIHEVQVRGPLIEQWPPATQTAVLGELPFEPGRTRAILEAFATRAYRRPVRADEADRLMAVVERRLKDGKEPLEALKGALKAILCSPAFLYLADPVEEPLTKVRPLSAHALATRLSYFIWSTTPDAELTKLAQTGELAQAGGAHRPDAASPRQPALGRVGFRPAR